MDLTNDQKPKGTEPIVAMSANGASNETKASEPQGKAIKPSKLFVEYYSSMVLLLAAILVGAGYLVIKPKLDDWKSLRAQTQATRAQAESDRAYYEGLTRSVAASEGIPADALSKMDKAMPRMPQIPERIVELEGIAANNGVKISSVAFEAGKAAVASAGLQSMNLNLTLEAQDYASMKNFLRALENNLRVIEIQNLSFSSSAEKSNVTFTLSAKVFYYPIGQTADATVAPAAAAPQPAP